LSLSEHCGKPPCPPDIDQGKVEAGGERDDAGRDGAALLGNDDARAILYRVAGGEHMPRSVDEKRGTLFSRRRVGGSEVCASGVGVVAPTARTGGHSFAIMPTASPRWICSSYRQSHFVCSTAC
jgi:hypothetical protein